MPNEILRSEFELHLRQDESVEDGRTLIGIAVPANQKAQIGPDEFEMIRSDAFVGSEDVILTSMHGPKGGVPIGTVTHEPTPEGVLIRARVSDTQAGRDALTLLHDGVYKGLSTGFYEGRSTKDGNTIIRETGRLFEVALVPSPAYKNARVLALREEQEPEKEKIMPDIDVAADIQHLREQNEDLARRISAFGTPTFSPAVERYRSAGHFLKALTAGEPEAFEIMRAYSGAVIADSNPGNPPAFVQNAIRLVQQNAVALHMFNRQPLPATGMAVDALRLGTNSAAYAEQVNEGDELVKSKISLTHFSAPIKTYGSWTEFSIQAAQRSPVSVLDLAYQAMLLEAAKVTDQAFIAFLAAHSSTTAPIVRATEDVAGWRSALIGAEIGLAANGTGQPAEFILTDLTTLGDLAGLNTNGIPFMTPQGATVNAGVSYGTVSTMDYTGVRGTVMGLPVIVDPLLPAHTTYVGNSSAFTVYGDTTPTRLQGDLDTYEISHLVTAFSIYQMLAWVDTFPKAIVQVNAHA